MRAGFRQAGQIQARQREAPHRFPPLAASAPIRWPAHPQPLQERLAGRLAALERFIDELRAAIRRLARKLRALPKLALKLACARTPRTRLYDNAEIADASRIVFGRAREFLDSS